MKTQKVLHKSENIFEMAIFWHYRQEQRLKPNQKFMEELFHKNI